MGQEIYKYQCQRHITVFYEDYSELENSTKNFDRDVPNRLKFKQKSTSTDERVFVENFANPITQILKEYSFIIVEEKDDKISLKVFWGHIQRKVGNVWFSKTKNVDYLTVNTKTGNIYQGKLTNYQKKKKFTRVTKMNYFVNQPLKTLVANLKNIIDRYGGEGYKESVKLISTFMDKIDNSKKFDNLDYDERLYRYYLDKKQIKYPNNFPIFKEVYYGPKFSKILKKNQRKLVETFMYIHDLNGKKIKKSLHECENLNVQLLKQAIRHFGSDWINQEERLVTQLLNSKVNVSDFQDDIREYATQEEMKKIFLMYKQVYVYQNLDWYTFSDHLRMYVKLKKYGETDLRWMASPEKGRDFFNQEHIDWTEKLQYYTSGIYERIYPFYFYDIIEKQIFDFQPVILDKTSSYNEESLIQHNCVKTYIGYVSSFIISLREVSDGNRISIEYRVHKLKNSGIIYADRVQTLGKYNSTIDSSWDDALKILDERVNKVFSDSRFETVKLKKKCANGVELFSDSEFSDDGYLGWTFKTMNYDFGYYI